MGSIRKILSGKASTTPPIKESTGESLISRLRDRLDDEDAGRPPRERPAATAPVPDPDILTMSPAAIRNELLLREATSYITLHRDENLSLTALELGYLEDLRGKLSVAQDTEPSPYKRKPTPAETRVWARIAPKIRRVEALQPDLVGGAVVLELRELLMKSRAIDGRPVLKVLELWRFANLELPKTNYSTVDLTALTVEELRFLRALRIALETAKSCVAKAPKPSPYMARAYSLM